MRTINKSDILSAEKSKKNTEAVSMLSLTTGSNEATEGFKILLCYVTNVLRVLAVTNSKTKKKICKSVIQ